MIKKGLYMHTVIVKVIYGKSIMVIGVKGYTFYKVEDIENILDTSIHMILGASGVHHLLPTLEYGYLIRKDILKAVLRNIQTSKSRELASYLC